MQLVKKNKTKNLQVFNVLWKFAEGRAWQTGNAWEIRRSRFQRLSVSFLVPTHPLPRTCAESSCPSSHVQHFNFSALLSCAMRVTPRIGRACSFSPVTLGSVVILRNHKPCLDICHLKRSAWCCVLASKFHIFGYISSKTEQFLCI